MKTIPVHNTKDVVIVDDDIFEKVKNYRWTSSTGGYVKRTVKTEKGWRNLKIHHVVLPVKDGFVVDHINFNKLDNRRENLRYLTNSENSYRKPFYKNNTSGYKGVIKRKNRWIAQIKYKNKQIHLGSFINKIDAKKKFDEFSVSNRKELACV